MKTRILWIFYFLFCVLLGGILSQCANPVNPTGGPKDQTGPKVLYMFPENGSLNFDYDEVHIYFDEYLRKGAYENEIFISPIPTVPPEIIVKSKGIVIRFNSDLMENTTYVITIGTGIVDANEGNKLKKPITYAFSTGDELDSLSITGRVVNPITGGGEDEFTVLLYKADSVPNHEIINRKPVYAAKTDANGAYKLSYLAEGKYHIYAVKDGDQDYTYSQPKEKIALAETALVEFKDSTYVVEKQLYSFLMDQEPPQVKSLKWINDRTLLAEFKENIRPAFESDSLRLFIQDTLGQNVEQVRSFEMIKGKNDEIFILTDRTQQDAFDIGFVGLRDSLGNKTDTLVRVDPESFNRKYKKKVYFGVNYNVLDNLIRLGTSLPIQDSLPDSVVTLIDTAGNAFPILYDHSRFQLLAQPQVDPQFGINYKFKINGTGLFQKGLVEAEDTLIPVNISFPNPENFGTLQGSVKDTTDDHNWILYLIDAQKAVVSRLDSSHFSLKYLKPGKYSFLLLDDEDGNGFWTPGSLNPYKLPEKYYFDPEAIDVKAKWDIEEWEVIPQERISEPDTTAGSKLAKLGGGKGTSGKGSSKLKK